MTMPNIRLKLERMHSQDPHCRWCGVETILKPKHQKRMTRATATFDHYPKPIKDHIKGEPHEGVLACYRCNTTRSNWELAKFMREVLKRTFGGDVTPPVAP